jgi:hypothetical protein
VTFAQRDIVQGYLQRGNLLPTELIIQILREKIEREKEKGHHRFLIDGFPRQIDQGIEFEGKVRNLLNDFGFLLRWTGCKTYTSHIDPMSKGNSSAAFPISQVAR